MKTKSTRCYNTHGHPFLVVGVVPVSSAEGPEWCVKLRDCKTRTVCSVPMATFDRNFKVSP